MKQKRIKPRKSTYWMVFMLGVLTSTIFWYGVQHSRIGAYKQMQAEVDMIEELVRGDLAFYKNHYDEYVMLINHTNAPNTVFSPKPTRKPKDL